MKYVHVLMVVLGAVARARPLPRRPSGTCRPPIRPPTSTPRTSASSPPTSTRRPAASSRSRCTPTRRCSRPTRSSARSRAARRRWARSCSVNFENEDAIFGARRPAVPGDSYAEAMKLYKASKRRALEKKLAEQGIMLLYTVRVAAAGHLRQQADQHRRRPEGPQVARLQPGHLAHRRARRRAAGHGAGGRAVAGDGHRRGRLVHVVGLDRLRHQDLRAASRTCTTRRPGCRRTR